MMNLPENVTLQFDLKDGYASNYSLTAFVPEFPTGVGWRKGTQQICSIKSNVLTEIVETNFTVTEVCDMGFGIFGRYVIDTDSNMKIAEYHDTGSWNLVGIKTKVYNNLYLYSYIGSFPKEINGDKQKALKEIQKSQTQYATALKKLIRIIRNYKETEGV